MKIVFDNPLIEEDITRTGVTPDHWIIYPGKQIILNSRDGASRVLPYDGLSKETIELYAAFFDALLSDTKGEFQSGEVTARADAKRHPVEPTPVEAIIPAVTPDIQPIRAPSGSSNKRSV